MYDPDVKIGMMKKRGNKAAIANRIARLKEYVHRFDTGDKNITHLPKGASSYTSITKRSNRGNLTKSRSSFCCLYKKAILDLHKQLHCYSSFISLSYSLCSTHWIVYMCVLYTKKESGFYVQIDLSQGKFSIEDHLSDLSPELLQ